MAKIVEPSAAVSATFKAVARKYIYETQI